MTQPPTGPEQPEDQEQPSGPQDPYGAPPPPPSYGTPAPPSYGAPPPPSYGTPAPPPPQGQPYGNPYAPPPPGATPYGQPAFGQPSGYPPPRVDGQPGKGMAIGALVSSFLCCLPVGLVLGIIVLRRSRDGRDHGKGLAIAAIVVNVLVMLASIALVAVAVVFGSQVRAVSDLEPGDCISAEGLRGDAQGFETITEEECGEPHDAEVMATATLTEEALAADTGDGDYGGLCGEAIADDPDRLAATMRDDVSLLVIYDVEEPGEEVACLALAADGGQLDAPLVD